MENSPFSCYNLDRLRHGRPHSRTQFFCTFSETYYCFLLFTACYICAMEGSKLQPGEPARPHLDDRHAVDEHWRPGRGVTSGSAHADEELTKVCTLGGCILPVDRMKALICLKQTLRTWTKTQHRAQHQRRISPWSRSAAAARKKKERRRRNIKSVDQHPTPERHRWRAPPRMFPFVERLDSVEAARSGGRASRANSSAPFPKSSHHFRRSRIATFEGRIG